ncbi:hypothetical protein [Paraburkholderia sp. BL21I4N1]|uniref:hypothetical protein n=1 Tax=Paraburkholderia sp. BL21I4N1 TaxID=1938801 RepID=UPI000D42FEF1|nr:hypothetical protein [Paraburkholderia sp. BL21I4N1]PQV43980.1 EthD domain-containing protein [Paraburkholderia sp. BL21I4N1]
MIRFWIVSKPREGDSKENFDYQWGCVHVALMLTTRSVMRGFHRYVQHRVPDGIEHHTFPYAFSSRNWYSCSDHVLDNIQALTEGIFGDEEYPRRMQPHKFGADDFVLELTSGGDLIASAPGFARGRGGVKLLNFIKRSDAVSQQDFELWWRHTYAPCVANAVAAGLVLAYSQSTQLPLEASSFGGTLFERGGVQTYAGIEELWFSDMPSISTFTECLDGYIRSADVEQHIDSAGSFSMPTVERVVFDQSDKRYRPAILDPATIESSAHDQERKWGEWNKVFPVS